MFVCVFDEVLLLIILYLFTDPSVTTNQSVHGDLPLGRSTNLRCRTRDQRALEYTWERSSGSSWIAVASGPVYTTDRNLSIGQYTHRCVVRNEVGSKTSNSVPVIVYGKYMS